MRPRSWFYGPRWFRFGRAEQINGLDVIVADIYSVHTGPRVPARATGDRSRRRLTVRVEILRRPS